jgi:hypothetical protein
MIDGRAACFAALSLFVAAACGSRPPGSPSPGSAATPTAVALSCQNAHFPFPPAAANLGAADAGKTFDVHIGDLIAVALLGKDAPGGRWPELMVQGDALLALPNPADAATVGTQLAEYCAARRGGATLTSGAWQATVNVR